MKIYKIKVNGKTYKVELESVEQVQSEKVVEEVKKEVKQVSTGEGNQVASPIQGTVLKVNVKVGDKVKKGQTVAVVEAMKLENDVVSPFEGEVVAVLVEKGANIQSKAPICVIK